MTVRRLIVCMSAVVAVSIVNVYHHALSVKHGYDLGRAQDESARLRVSIANLEGEVATLSGPSRLRTENERMQLSLVDPGNWRRDQTALAYAEAAEGVPTDLLNR